MKGKSVGCNTTQRSERPSVTYDSNPKEFGAIPSEATKASTKLKLCLDAKHNSSVMYPFPGKLTEIKIDGSQNVASRESAWIIVTFGEKIFEVYSSLQ